MIRHGFRGRCFCPASLLLVFVLSIVAGIQEARGAISYVQETGTFSQYWGFGGPSSIDIPVSAGVTAGNSVIVTMLWGTWGSGETVTCSDSQGNTYSTDGEIFYSSAGQYTVICSAHNVTALTTSDVVTVSFSGPPYGAAVVISEFSGLAASALDQMSSAVGSSATPSSGSVVTTQADELLMGAIGVNSASTTFTAGAGYTALPSQGFSSTWQGTIYPEYRIVSTSGSYQADGVLGTSAGWGAVIATYKAATGTAITVSGTLYSDEGTTPLAGQTVRLVVEGSSVGTATTDGSGSYTITATVSPSDPQYVPLLLYVDDGSVDAVTVTAMDTTVSTSLTGLHLYADRLVLRNDHGVALDNGDLQAALGGYVDGGTSTNDILYSVTFPHLFVSGANTELFVPTGHTFAPGGNVSTIHVQIDGTLDAGANTFTVSGSWDHSAGTFNRGTSTVDFTGSGTITVSGAWWTKPFYNVTAAATGQTTTIAAGIAVTNVLTLGDGTLSGGSVNLSLNSGTPLVVSSGTTITSSIKYHPNSGGPINVAAATYRDVWMAGNATTNTFNLTGNMSCNKLTVVGSGAGDSAVFDTAGHSIDCNTLVIGSTNLDRYGTLRLNGSVVTVSGSVTIHASDSGGTNELDAGSAIIHVGGDWTDDDTFTYGTSTVDFTGSGTIDVGDSGNWWTKPFYNVTAAAAGQTTTILAGQGIAVENDLVLGSGTLAGGDVVLNKSAGTPLTTSATLSNSSFMYSTQTTGTVYVTPASYPDLRIAGWTSGATNTFQLAGNISCNTLQIAGTDAGSLTILDTGAGNHAIDCSSLEVGAAWDSAIYNRLVLNGSSVTISGAVTIHPSDTGGSNEIDAGSAIIHVGGDWTNGDTFTYGTSTVDFTGSGTIDNGSGWTAVSRHFYDVNAAASGQTTTVASAGGMVVENALSLGSGTLAGGKVYLRKDGGTPLLLSGTTLSNSLFRYTPSTGTVNVTSAAYPDLSLAARGASADFLLQGDISCNTLWVLGNSSGTKSILDTTAGDHSVTCNQLRIGLATNSSRNGELRLNGSVLDINGDLFIQNGGGNNVLNAGTGTIRGSGDWTNEDTFIAGTSSVILDGSAQSIVGSTTFHHLTKTVTVADTLTFTAGTTQTVTGAATLQGASGQLLALRSSSPGTRWNLQLASGAIKAISHVDVMDSDASGSDPALLDINPGYSVDSGNNVRWFGNANITVTKSSIVISDPVNGTVNPKRIPGAVVEYVITVTNTAGAQATDVTLTDDLSGESATISFLADAYGSGRGIRVVVPNINGGTVTDLTNVADSDQGDYGGTTANAVTVGGMVLNAGEQATIRFRVEIQ